MASLIRNKRRLKLVTPSNSSFSNCVEDQLFIQPIRKPLETFKPVVYLDEQGRRHGRVSDHLLQRQIENDRQKLKKQPIPKVPVSSNLYGIRNPNIAALIKDVPYENDDNDDEQNDRDKLEADDEVKFIEYKKFSKPATSKTSNRQSVSGKQSVKFDTTPSVNMTRFVESHLTELDDIDNVDDDDESESEDDDDEEDLESIKPANASGSNYRSQADKSAGVFSETPSTPKTNNNNNDDNDDDDDDDGTPTDSALDYNQQSHEVQMPPTIEDIHDTEEEEEEEEEKQSQQQGESENELSSPDIPQRQKESLTSSEKTEARPKSSSSRPKTAPSTRSRSENEEAKSSRSSSTTSSDDTSALLRSDNDNSQNLSENEINNEEDEEEQAAIETPIKSDHPSPNISDTMNIVDQQNISPQSIDKLQQRDVKGDYDPSKVIQLKESFQPIINEAASYGHIDVVRKLIKGGQSVHTQNLLKRTPLHEACVSGNGQLVSELLDKEALIDQRDSQGMTPLHVAASHGTLKCIRILCEKGCDINAQDNLGQTAAHYSAMHNHVDALKYLINIKHIDLSLSNNESKLPIHYAAKHGSKNVLNLFFQLNITIYATDNHGNTITHEASEYNQLDCIKLIWKINRSLFKLKNHFGRTPIHTAALFGSTDVLHWLLELDIIDIDRPDNDGYTMAHLAASRGHGECFSCLIIHGAQLDVYTFDRHESVLNVAKRSGKNGRIEQARSGVIRCHCCEEKLAKEKNDRAHARNAVEQLIHTQIQRGYNLNVPVNRTFTNLSQRNRPTT